MTGQPYAFTADDPLNATDPDGLAPRPCDEVSSKIKKQQSIIEKRYKDIQADKRGEFGPNPPKSGTTAHGHLQALAEAQKGLQNLLNEWSGNGCGGGGTPAPANAYHWAYVAPPRAAPASALGPGSGGPAWSASSPPSSEQYFAGDGRGLLPSPTAALGAAVVTGVIGFGAWAWQQLASDAPPP
jgi:hypothetical protein